VGVRACTQVAVNTRAALWARRLLKGLDVVALPLLLPEEPAMNVRSAFAVLCLSFAACSGTELPRPEPMPLPNPLTGVCAGLDEGACNASPSCVAVYGVGEEPQPVPVVGVVSGCMPFEPEPPAPFHHCEEMPPVDTCAGLDEVTCNATAGCQAQYEGGGIALGPNADPAAVATVGYVGCAAVAGGEVPPSPDVCPAVACLIYCEHGEVLDANGCTTCECLP
jgi:hypothetical protein